jgi:hypothetical protein
MKLFNRWRWSEVMEVTKKEREGIIINGDVKFYYYGDRKNWYVKVDWEFDDAQKNTHKNISDWKSADSCFFGRRKDTKRKLWKDEVDVAIVGRRWEKV